MGFAQTALRIVPQGRPPCDSRSQFPDSTAFVPPDLSKAVIRPTGVACGCSVNPCGSHFEVPRRQGALASARAGFFPAQASREKMRASRPSTAWSDENAPRNSGFQTSRRTAGSLMSGGRSTATSDTKGFRPRSSSPIVVWSLEEPEPNRGSNVAKLLEPETGRGARRS